MATLTRHARSTGDRPAREVDRPPALPERVDVVVVGGGIIGAFTALELLERGLTVALCEKGTIGCEQSSRNWGWVRVSRRDPREIELVLEAQRLWQGVSARLGEPVGYRRCGIGFVAHDSLELERQQRWLQHAEAYGIRTRLLAGEAFAKRYPGVHFNGLAALHTEDDGRAEPGLAAPAVARRCQHLGGHVLSGCAVRGLETAAGRIGSVVTEHGVIGTDAVVLAAGAWSSLFCANLDIRLPQLKLLSSALRTSPVAEGPHGSLWTRDYAIRRREDGGFTVADGHYNVAQLVPDSLRYFKQFLPSLRAEWHSLAFGVGRQSLRELRTPRHFPLDAPTPFEASRILDPAPTHDRLDRAMQALVRDVPALREARVVQRWAGMIDVTPDALPVISTVERLPGLHIATGFSGHGFGIAPGAGRLMADIVTDAAPVVDPAAFRLSRFDDGSPILFDS